MCTPRATTGPSFSKIGRNRVHTFFVIIADFHTQITAKRKKFAEKFLLHSTHVEKIILRDEVRLLTLCTTW